MTQKMIATFSETLPEKGSSKRSLVPSDGFESLLPSFSVNVDTYIKILITEIQLPNLIHDSSFLLLET